MGMALVLLLIVFTIWIATRYSNHFKAANHGFGRDWQCVNPTGDDPICVRQPSPKPLNPR
jgi:hypothetical protein